MRKNKKCVVRNKKPQKDSIKCDYCERMYKPEEYWHYGDYGGEGEWCPHCGEVKKL